MTTQNCGILHPGAMGISIAATMQNSGHPVYWASEGRSPATQARAAEHNLLDAQTLTDLCATCDVLVSVCPPHAAEALAQDVVDRGFTGLYIDANAIAPARAARINQIITAAGGVFVDGGIVGGPAWEPNRTWLYLSGPAAEEAAACFHAGPLETEIMGDEVGRASAFKMVFAANTKGATALLCAVLAAAENLGVREALERQWTRYDPASVETSHQRMRGVTAKAWRFAGEMDEIAATFEAAGLPGGFHQAAGEVYHRLAGFKAAPELPDIGAVLAALGEDDPA